MSKEVKAAYDKKRRAAYAVRKAELRKKDTRKAVEKVATLRWKSLPENWARNLLTQAKSRAKRKGIPFEISLDDVVIPSHCPVLGMKLLSSREATSSTAVKDNAPSLDKVDNAKGYVKGNVRVISYRANKLKGDATLDEVEAIAKYMRGEQSLLL